MSKVLLEGISEPLAKEHDDAFAQFERYGLVRIEVNLADDNIEAFFAHR